MNRLESDLERARARYERAIAELDERADELERRARSRAVIESAMQHSEERERSDAGAIRLRDATFEDLRAAGLSVTQAKRVFSLQRRGFLSSAADLDAVPGISQDQLRELREHFHD